MRIIIMIISVISSGQLFQKISYMKYTAGDWKVHRLNLNSFSTTTCMNPSYFYAKDRETWHSVIKVLSALQHGHRDTFVIIVKILQSTVYRSENRVVLSKKDETPAHRNHMTRKGTERTCTTQPKLYNMLSTSYMIIIFVA